MVYSKIDTHYLVMIPGWGGNFKVFLKSGDTSEYDNDDDDGGGNMKESKTLVYRVINSTFGRVSVRITEPPPTQAPSSSKGTVLAAARLPTVSRSIDICIGDPDAAPTAGGGNGAFGTEPVVFDTMKRRPGLLRERWRWGIHIDPDNDPNDSDDAGYGGQSHGTMGKNEEEEETMRWFEWRRKGDSIWAMSGWELWQLEPGQEAEVAGSEDQRDGKNKKIYRPWGREGNRATEQTEEYEIQQKEAECKPEPELRPTRVLARYKDEWSLKKKGQLEMLAERGKKWEQWELMVVVTVFALVEKDRRDGRNRGM